MWRIFLQYFLNGRKKFCVKNILKIGISLGFNYFNIPVAKIILPRFPGRFLGVGGRMGPKVSAKSRGKGGFGVVEVFAILFVLVFFIMNYSGIKELRNRILAGGNLHSFASGKRDNASNTLTNAPTHWS